MLQNAAKCLVFNKDQLFLWLVNTNCGGKNLLLAFQLHHADKRQELKIILTQAFLSSVINALTSGAKTLSVRSVLTLEMQFVSYSHRQML